MFDCMKQLKGISSSLSRGGSSVSVHQCEVWYCTVPFGSGVWHYLNRKDLYQDLTKYKELALPIST